LYGGTPGGYSTAHGFGPYAMAQDESIHIVLAEGISGLSRQLVYDVGAVWLEDPDNNNDYKNEMVMTGRDSLIKTFENAQENYQSNFEIPQPPPPPEEVTVSSGGDMIALTWANNAQGWTDEINGNSFAGYRVYRAIQIPDTTYELVFACGPGTDNPEVVHMFEDKSPRRGFDYYYYMTSFDDGSTSDGVLESSKFYTMTNEPAFLRRPAENILKDIRIVPNPYNKRAEELQFGVSGADRILFVNLPPYCDIKIYTERGDLINTLHHTDGTGDEAWNSITSSRQVVVSGVYIAHIEVTEDTMDEDTGRVLLQKGETVIKKFVIIR